MDLNYLLAMGVSIFSAIVKSFRELTRSRAGDYIYLIQVLDGVESEVDMMDLERPSGPTVSGEEQGAVTALPSKHDKRKRNSTAPEHTNREDSGNEASIDEETKSENEAEGEENDSENNAEEEDEEDDDDNSDDDDDWELEEEQIQSELEDDPRIRTQLNHITSCHSLTKHCRASRSERSIRTTVERALECAYGEGSQFLWISLPVCCIRYAPLKTGLVEDWALLTPMAGSDDGNIFIWDKLTGELLIIMKGDSSIVNCVQGIICSFNSTP